MVYGHFFIFVQAARNFTDDLDLDTGMTDKLNKDITTKGIQHDLATARLLILTQFIGDALVLRLLRLKSCASQTL